ncbi:MAG: hypothetical protein U0903_16475 [Planctomycetales bacterium]
MLLRRASSTIAVLSILMLLPGCITVYTRFRDLRDELQIKAHNKYLAHMAWGACKKMYADLPCRDDFERGFKTGYVDRASGLNGCPPALPPRRYWKAKNMGMGGADRTNTWFDGYRHGVAVAEQDGVADLSRITTSVPFGPPPPSTIETQQINSSEPTPIPEEYLNGNGPQAETPEILPSPPGNPGTAAVPLDPSVPKPPEPTYDEAPKSPNTIKTQSDTTPATQEPQPQPVVPPEDPPGKTSL